MISYEELSDNAKLGLESFRKDIPNLLKEFQPFAYDFGDGKYDSFSYKDDKHKWNPPISAVVAGYCLSKGASITEMLNAIHFAREKNYWL